MRLTRYCTLLVVLLALCFPAVSQACAQKAATKIVFAGTQQTDMEDDDLPWHYAVNWSWDTKSVPTPSARGRLLYYKSSTKRWVGYGKRRVSVAKGYPLDIMTRKTTDSRGYFTFKLIQPDEYTAAYAGSARSKKSSMQVMRIDNAPCRVGPAVISTRSVDATRSLVTVAIDYWYNPHVDQGMEPYTINAYINVNPRDSGRISMSTQVQGTGNIGVAPGVGHIEFSYLLPADVLANADMSSNPWFSYGAYIWAHDENALPPPSN